MVVRRCVAAAVAAVVVFGGFSAAPVWAAAGDEAVTSMSPNAGALAGGEVVAVVGTGFTGGEQVDFDGQPASVAFVDSTHLQVKVPSAKSAHRSDVRFVNARGAEAFFPYLYGTQITGMTPSSGGTPGGESVVIHGTFFTPDEKVLFDGDSVPVEFRSSTELRVLVPPTAKPHVATVTVRGENTGQAPVTIDGGYTYKTETLTLSPAFGGIAGGNVVEVTGTDFQQRTDGTNPDPIWVYFDGVAGRNVVVDSPTTLHVTVPQMPADTNPGQKVDVETADYRDGHHVLAINAYTVLKPLQISSVSSATAGTPMNYTDTGAEGAGLPITVTGAGFTGVKGASFDGYPATNVKVVNDSEMTLNTPITHPVGAGKLTITNPASNTSAEIAFSFYHLIRQEISHATLQSLEAAAVADYTCPAKDKWLFNHNFDHSYRLGGSMPGVALVQSNDDANLTVVGTKNDGDKVIGFNGSLLALSEGGSDNNSVTLYAFCTNDTNQAAPAP